MKVSELVQKLSALDPDLDVLCWCEDESIMGGEPGFLLLHPEDVSPIAGECTRDENGKPGFKIAAGTPTLAVIEVSSEF